MLHDGPTSVGRWRLGGGLPWTRFFCSIRSRYDQGQASRPPSAQMGTPRTRGEMRPCPEGNSPPPWRELSLWHAIEMQPSFHHASTPACTHACPVTPCLGVDSQRTVTQKDRRIAHIFYRYRTLLVCCDQCAAALLGSNTPSVRSNLLSGT